MYVDRFCTHFMKTINELLLLECFPLYMFYFVIYLLFISLVHHTLEYREQFITMQLNFLKMRSFIP